MSYPSSTKDPLALQLTRENRLRLSRTIAIALLTLGAGYVIAFNLLLLFVPATHIPLFFVVDAVIMLAVSGWALAIPTTRSGRVNRVASLIVISFGLAITALLVSFMAIPLLQPLLLSGIGAYMLVIVLAGVLGSVSLIILTTICANILALAFLILDTHAGAIAFSNQFWLLGPQTLIQQWAVAIFTIVLGQVYLRTLGQLSTSLHEIDRARQLDDLKNQFINSVNHELRNPVMTLQGLIETILVGFQRGMEPAILEDLARRANRVGDGLRQLIMSILEVRHTDQEVQNLAPTTIPLIAAIEAATMLISGDTAMPLQRELRLKIAPDLTLWADPTRFQEILINLLSNAVKYSEDGTPIEIAADAILLQEREMIEMRFRDWGLGIPPEQIPLLFNRFVRLPRDLASNVIGNGLGLYLCRELVQAMAGTITVESAGIVGEGSTFIVRLPRCEVSPAA